MEITDVSLVLVNSEKATRLKAVAKMVIDDAFCVKEMRVIEHSDGRLFVAMPASFNDGQFRDICHPINRETREQIEKVILDLYYQTLEDSAEGPTYGKKIFSK